MTDRYGPTDEGQSRRWLRILLIVVALVALVVVVVNVAGAGLGGHQGPCQHLPEGCDGDTDVTEPNDRHTGPPPGIDHAPGD